MSSSGLFANQRETNLASTVSLVEATLVELGHSVARSRIEDPAALHAWQITKGSASSRISILDRPEFSHVRVTSVVMTMDAKVDRTALFSHLLELNAGLCGAAFATDGDRVLLVSERSTLDIDRSEVLELIKRVATYADDHDDVLVARFGGRLGVASPRTT